MQEIEIFRISLKPGHYYETAEFTRSEGRYPNEKYYTKNTPKYVGKFIKHQQYGYGDGATHIDIFDDNGKEIQVYYSYDCTTSFREIQPIIPQIEIKQDLLAKTDNTCVK